MAKFEAVEGGIGILPSFYMGMCACKAGQCDVFYVVFTQELLLSFFSKEHPVSIRSDRR
jgi:hypothetical protein